MRHQLARVRGRLRRIVHPPRVKGRVPPPFPGGLVMDEDEENAASEAAREVIRSKRLFRGGGVPDPRVPSRVDQFEDAFAQALGCEHALAVNSGTSAIIAALAGLGVGPGDEVIVPAVTWLGTATSVVAVGAVPVVADIDDSLTIDPADVRDKLSPYTKAIIPVHLLGAPAAMDELTAIARESGTALIEDTAQSPGASYHGKRLGTIGEMGIFSFQMSKIITAGEGGAITTNIADLHRRAAMYQDTGSIHHVPGVSADEWMPGQNLRLSELHAAVLLVQLGRLDGLIADMRARKKKLKRHIEQPLRDRGIGFRTLHDPEGEAATALVVLLPDPGFAERFAVALGRENVRANLLYRDDTSSPDFVNTLVYPGWRPILEKRAWSAAGAPWANHPRPIDYPADACSRSAELMSRAVYIEVSPLLSDEQVEQMGAAIVETTEKLA